MNYLESTDYRFFIIILVIGVIGSLVALEYSTKTLLNKTISFRKMLIISLGLGFGLSCINIVGILGMYSPDGLIDFYGALLLISCLFGSIGSLFGFYIISMKEPFNIQYMVSGSIFAVAILSAQYLGVASLKIPGEMIFDWSYVFLSFLLALLLVFTSLYLSRLQDVKGENSVRNLIKKLVKAIIMGGLLFFMQITVFNGLYFNLEDRSSSGVQHSLDMIIVALYIGVAAVFIFISFIIALYVSNQRVLYQKSISDEKFKSLFHYNPLIVLELNKEGKIKDVNKTFLNQMGYTKEQVIDVKIHNLFPTNYSVLVQDSIHKTLTRKAKITYELPIVRKDGNLLPIDVAFFPIQQGNKTIGIYLIGRDLLERNIAQDRQQSAEKELMAILKNQLGVITKFIKINNQYVYTLIDGKLLYRVGLSPAMVRGKALNELSLPQDEYQYHLSHYEQARSGKEVTYEFSYNDFYLLSSLMPVRKDGKTIEVVSTIMDITKQKNAENEMLLSKELADKANSAKSQFLSKMSHELRTPLNGVLGFTQVLEMEDGLTDIHRSHIKEIHTAGRHLLKLIDSVLDLSRIESGNLPFSIKEVSLNKVLSQSIKLIERDAENNEVTISSPPADQVFTIQADSTKLRQVFINLLDNAVKYNRRGGHVSISVSQVEGYVSVSIEDTGIGISTEEIGEVVKPFFRSQSLQPTISGAGIGLSLVKQIIDTLNGRLYIESEIGKGTIITVKLPMIKESEYFQPKKEQLIAALDISPSTVLYIEDNQMNQRFMKGILNKEKNVNLLISSTGREGISMFKSLVPDLVLLDLDLPDISGLNVLDIIRNQESSDIPVVAVSANALKSDIERALSHGFHDYITKPVESNKLYRILNKHLKGEDEER